MGPEALAQVLRPLRELFPAQEHPEVLVGLGAADDAAIFRLTDDIAIINTADFFPPVVDDPYAFGAIAAANAMSDVYAMGGEVLFALNLVAFPEHLDPAILSEVLRGGAEKVREAGAVIAGGHTITDREPKYGLAVTGRIHPQHIATKAGARPGDRLYLSKPLGTGIVTTAAKGDAATASDLQAAIDVMSALNRPAAVALRAADVRAATDITGFSFVGHAWEMAAQSQVDLAFTVEQLPFISGAQCYARDWLFPAGTERNYRYYIGHIVQERPFDDELVRLLLTPETSGGLLLAVPPARCAIFEEALRAAGGQAQAIGEALPGDGHIRLR
jgi:selenide, water dikinase